LKGHASDKTNLMAKESKFVQGRIDNFQQMGIAESQQQKKRKTLHQYTAELSHMRRERLKAFTPEEIARMRRQLVGAEELFHGEALPPMEK
jgi:hypothetical protein